MAEKRTNTFNLFNKKAPISSPQLTGIPLAPTPPLGENSTRIATCDWVNEEIANWLPDPIVTYTVKIDTANPNPDTSCTYIDDAYGMEKGSNRWEDMPIFKDIKPCVFKNDEVQYYLNKDNFNLKEDGSPAILTGEDGNVMIEIPKFGYKIWYDEDETYLYVSITNNITLMNSENGYRTYAFSRNIEGDKNKIYAGAFKGSLNNNKLLSIITNNTTAHNGFTLETAKNAASANGENYTILGYAQFVMLQCLYIIKYCSLNGQEALGQGSLFSMPSNGTTLTNGMYYGNPDNINTPIKFAGLENFWGGNFDGEVLDGIKTDENNTLYITYNNTTYQYNLLNEEIYTYPSKVIGNTEFGFIVKYDEENFYLSNYGSMDTFFCDANIIFPDSFSFGIGGGIRTQGADAGPFYFYQLLENASARLWYI